MEKARWGIATHLHVLSNHIDGLDSWHVLELQHNLLTKPTGVCR